MFFYSSFVLRDDRDTLPNPYSPINGQKMIFFDILALCAVQAAALRLNSHENTILCFFFLPRNLACRFSVA